jgi:hypothetical protein
MCVVNFTFNELAQGGKILQPDQDQNLGPSEYLTVAWPTELSSSLHIFSSK